MKFAKYLKESGKISNKKYEIYCNDRDNNLLKILEHIKKIGNVGHSFNIVIDPENSDTRGNFGWDGDGADSIQEIKVFNIGNKNEV